jgi:urocanate hydratase
VHDPQVAVLRAYTTLRLIRPDWGGAVVLSLGLGEQGSTLARAAHIAGAVCLTLEPSASLARAALRSGACDFVVNTLDEALRTMKNEVRKRQPLSVGLEGDLAETLSEMVERGVQPHLIANTSAGPADHDASLASLCHRGSLLLDDHSAALTSYLHSEGLALHIFPAANTTELRGFDAFALSLLHDDLRCQWLRVALSVLPREATPRRVLWATAQEATQLATRR